ncbi:MAG: class I SAM-dependent methyltransferase [bacterium]|nr:class I SAM-dependent methyltransferase [bacterium]
MRLLLLRMVRKLLKETDILIERKRRGLGVKAPDTNHREADIEAFLLSLDVGGPEAQAYFRSHLGRIVYTLSQAPPGNGRASALELGSYLHMSAALERILGYGSVVGAYYSPEPGHEQKSLAIRGQHDFTCEIDLFDVEKHAFPYPDGAFDLVLCCELIEHLVRDPMHLLFECHRILTNGGLLLLSTPNVASLTSVACVLHGWRNPQVFSSYPTSTNPDTPHVREYTPSELAGAARAAGFEVDSLITERLPEFDEGAWVQNLLEEHGFDTSLRGEQTYCLARKTGVSPPQERYPSFLYAK